MVLAVLPSQGVAPGLPGSGHITLRVFEVSGRGAARFAVLLPVHLNPQRDRYEAHLPLPGAMHCADLGQTPRQVIPLSAPCTLWPAGAEGVLVVLLYDQTNDVGAGRFNQTYRLRRHVTIGTPGLAPAPSGLPLPVVPVIGHPQAAAMAAAVTALLGERPPEAVRPCIVPAEVVPAPAARQGLAAAPADAGLCFALASCQYAAGMLDAQPAGASYARLAQRLADGQAPRPRFLVQTGDQVYVDATAGLFDPAVADERFGLCYERRGMLRPWQEVQRQLDRKSVV